MSRLETEKAIIIYVLNGLPYVEMDLVELSEKQKDVLDWGAVTLTFESANKWQVKE